LNCGEFRCLHQNYLPTSKIENYVYKNICQSISMNYRQLWLFISLLFFAQLKQISL
jgi:hypothetical protein